MVRVLSSSQRSHFLQYVSGSGRFVGGPNKHRHLNDTLTEGACKFDSLLFAAVHYRCLLLAAPDIACLSSPLMNLILPDNNALVKVKRSLAIDIGP